jgi:hypothetical protein
MSLMGNSIGVSGMGWRSQRARKRALACVAVVGVGSLAGLLAAFSADPVQGPDLSPAAIVAMRFPGGASRIVSNPVALSSVPAVIDASPAPAGYVLASAGDDDISGLMFNPFPTYSSAPQLASAHSVPATLSAANSSTANSSAAEDPHPAPVRSALPPQLVTASIELPTEALGYADEPAARADNPTPTPAKRAVQAPHPTAIPGPVSASNAVLNNAQIASIRERLKLTSYQSQLWPPVESALRDISWQGHPDAGRKVASNALPNGHGATIDPNSPPVQRLKSAAFPLIMSLSEEQKQEVRSMVRLMGLENLAAQF